MLQKLGPADTATLHDRIYRQLATAMMDGRFPPGQTITLHNLAELLGTSIMPVREAVKRLLSQYALEMPTPRRIRVPLGSQSILADLFVARGLVECEAVAGAAASMQREAVIEHCQALSRDAVRCLESGDIEAAVNANREFWLALFQGSDSRVFAELAELLWVRFGPYLSLALVQDTGFIATALGVPFHESVLRCVRDGDAVGARAAVQLCLSEIRAVFRQLDAI